MELEKRREPPATLLSSIYAVLCNPVKYLLWRPIGRIVYGNTLAFEDLPFLQSLSMLGSSLSFTHSNFFFPITYFYKWRNFCKKKKEPVMNLGVFGGTAQSAGLFVMSLNKHPHALLSAVGSRTVETGEACIKKYFLESKVYSPYDELIADPYIQGVILFTPIATHGDLQIKLMQAGKHCILIPPMAANARELKRVWDYQQENYPHMLCISAYSALTHPVNHKMRDLIRKGAVGKVQRILIKAKWPAHLFHPQSIQFNYSLAGGAFEDLGPHAITLARFMLDHTQPTDSDAKFEVQSAVAKCASFDSNVDEAMSVAIQYGNVSIEIEASLVEPMDISITIEGTEGMLHQKHWFKPELFNELTYRKAGSNKSMIIKQNSDKGCCEYLLDYLADHDSFNTLDTPPLASFEEEMYTMEIVDEVYRQCGLGERCPWKM